MVAPRRSSAQPSVWQGVHRWRRWSGTEVRGVFASHPVFFISLRNWTPNGTVKSNTGLFWGGRRKETKSHRGTGTTNFYTRSCVFFFLSKKMPWCSEIPLQDNVHILVYVWCSSFVQYIVLFQFFALPNMYPSLMTSPDPGNALFIVFCQNEYWEISTGKTRWLGKWKEMWCEVFFSEVSQATGRVELLISKEATSQNKAFCTSPQWNISSYFLYFCFFLFFFLSPLFSLVCY